MTAFKLLALIIKSVNDVSYYHSYITNLLMPVLIFGQITILNFNG
jgi:hypothetical protein